MDDVALARTLTLAVRAVVDEMHDRLARAGFDDLRPAFGYVLNATAGGPMTASDVADLLGMTKQGAAKVLAEMTSAGYVVRAPSEVDGRAKPVALTDQGRAALAEAERAQRAIERELVARTSAADVEAMRRVLAAAIEARSPEGRPTLRPVW